MRTYINELADKKGEIVDIYGWVNTRRDQGKMIFLDLRDISGVVQAVILPNSQSLSIGKTIREEFVVKIAGKVNQRPQKNIKQDAQNGDIELEIIKISILNQSETLPFPINSDTRKIEESTRLRYRYLDMRNNRLHKNIVNRSKIQHFIRNYLHNQNFIEVETPLLSAPTPEGARSFVVPSRIHENQFYSLPQSPQQYKQLLMVGGFEKYFQFAKYLRYINKKNKRLKGQLSVSFASIIFL